MGNWGEGSLSEVLEYPFDFERYIEARVREIKDLDERAFAKDVLVKGFSKAIQVTEERYRGLERRIYEETRPQGNQYGVVTTVVRQEHYDAINRTLFPVWEDDLQGQALVGALSTESENYVGTVYLELAERELANWKPERRLAAWQESDTGRTRVEILVRPAKRYHEAVESLYQVFQDNGIPWETVHMGYLDRFFDLFVARGPLPALEATLTGLDIQWGEAAGRARYQMVPLWNIERLSFDSEKFKEAVPGESYYAHEIKLKEWKEGDGYLIEKNADILEIRHEAQKMVIKSPQEEFHDWKMLHLSQGQTIRSLDYGEAFLSNYKRDTFLGGFVGATGARLMTKAELFRQAMDLDIREYVQVAGYEIRETLPEAPVLQGMNWFMGEGVAPSKHRRVLALRFEAVGPERYLTDSMVNFAVSQLQMGWMEYYLVGVRA